MIPSGQATLELYPDVMAAIVDRAACGEWPLPETPSDFLAWIMDEVEVQQDMIRDTADNLECTKRKDYIALLVWIGGRLRRAHVKPSALPWESGDKELEQ